ncbi:MAG: ABC transporter substrate-binding protein [Alphaproteobacteria bacterium]
MKKLLLAATMGVALGVGSAQAADPVKIGFVTTLTTPAAVIGNDMRDAFELALEHIGGEMGGRTVEVIYEDDEFKPESGLAAAEKLVEQDEVDFVTGFIWSHVLLASARTVLDSDTFLISANAGPSPLAGENCHPNFFSVSWQNDQTPMAMGQALNERGVESVYLMAPNYAAGQDMVAGVSRTFEGEVVGQDLTRWGADAQLDFSAELAKAAQSGADALWVFYPGRAGGAFINQYTQAGLADSLPLYTVFTVDALSLPRLQEAGLTGVLGSLATQHWSPDMDNAANQRFVGDFLERYGRYPSFYAQQSYDAMMLIKSAVDAVGGDLSDMDAVREALMAADFESTRGEFRFGNNHFPIQDFYLRETVEDSEGRWTTQIVQQIFDDHQDSYASDCGM